MAPGVPQRRIGMDTPCHPPREVAPVQPSFAGRLSRAEWGRRIRSPLSATETVPGLRGDAVQLDGQPVGERVRRRLDAALNTPSQRRAGRSCPRPAEADRHRRSAGRGTTRSRPATCGTRVPHNWAAFPCTSTPMSFSHLRIGHGLRRTAPKSGLRKGGHGSRFRSRQ